MSHPPEPETADSSAIESTNQLLRELAATAMYNAKKLAWLHEQLSKTPAPALADLLQFRGHALAQAGYTDAAIRDLSALVSEPSRATADNLNKLAQQLVYRACENDIQDAIRITSSVAADETATAQQKFFALDLRAQAQLVAGQHDDAMASAEQALVLHDDDRTKAVHSLAAERRAPTGLSRHTRAFSSAIQPLGAVSACVDNHPSGLAQEILLRSEPTR